VQHVYADTFLITQAFMGAPMPRMYVETVPGRPEPTEGEGVVGTGVDSERLMNAVNGGTDHMKNSVLDGLTAWLHGFKTNLTPAVEEVDRLRLLLDSRRRTVAGLEGTHTFLAHTHVPLLYERQILDIGTT
jgi:hypothetical protein